MLTRCNIFCIQAYIAVHCSLLTHVWHLISRERVCVYYSTKLCLTLYNLVEKHFSTRFHFHISS